MLIVIRRLFLVLKIILSFYVGFKEDSNSIIFKCDILLLILAL